MIRSIDHVGIAVRALEDRLPFWAEALGMEVETIETVDAEGVKTAFLSAGGSCIELLEPCAEDSPIAGFLNKRGEGIHHLTLSVSDLDRALSRVRERGVEVIGGGARKGAGGSRVAFLHPKSTGGVLVELVQRAAVRAEAATEIVPGAPVLVYLHEPQEKLWGVMRKLDASGVVLEGIDLASFDDWVAQIERDEESVVGPSVLFVPMGRLDKILLDRSSGHLPSLADRFERRTGRSLDEILGAMHRDEPRGPEPT